MTTGSTICARRNKPYIRTLLRAALAVLVIATSSLAAPGTAGAEGLEISGLEPISYTEGGPAVPVAPGIVITSAGTFADGYIEFASADAASDDRLFLPEGTTPSTTKDAITVVGSAVFLGLGDDKYKQIGTVASPNDGEGGRPLRVNFSAALPNSSFDDGKAEWVINQNVITLGSLATKSQGRAVTTSGSGPYTVSGPGYSFQSDWNYTPGASGWAYESQERALESGSSFNSEVTSDVSNTNSLRLWFSGQCVSGSPSYCSAFGPDAWSSPFEAKAGDDLAFDWKAANGGDDYEVYGFLVDVDSGVHTELMYGRGRLQPWTTSRGVIPADGTYKFRFVSGSYDATGGRVIGASLYIDNVRVLSSDATAAVAQSIARQVHYENTGNNPPAEVSIGVTAKSSEGTTGPETVPVETTLVDDPPTVDPPTSLSFTNTYGDTTFANQSGTVTATDPEGDPITYSITGGTAADVTIDAVQYTHLKKGTYGTLHLNQTTGKYVLVPDSVSLNGALSASTESFTLVATANGLTGSEALTVSVGIATSVPGSPTGLVATGADGTVNLSWSAPAWTGGSEIDSYKIESSVDGETWTTVAASTGTSATTYEVSGLENGTPSYFRISAINSTGTGTASEPMAGTPRTVPGAPTITAITPGNKTLTIDFRAPDSDGGSTLSTYEYSLDGGLTWVARRTGTTESPLVVGPVPNGTTRPVRIRAVNVAGPGASSNEIAAAPAAAPVLPADGTPAAPTGSARLIVDGQERPISLRARTSGSGTPNDTLSLSDGSFKVDLMGRDADGRPLALDPEGRLVIVAGAFAQASGHGFLPGSTVDVWLMSTPILLGVVTVGPDGTFSSRLAIPAGIAPGPHTIQLNGVGADSSVRTVSIGVVVQKAADGAKAPSATGAKAPSSDGSTPAKLAFTGAMTGTLALLGLGLLLMGSAIASAQRRRLAATTRGLTGR